MMRHLSFFQRFFTRRKNRRPSTEANIMERRQSQPHDSRSLVSWTVWIALATAFWLLVFIIANVIPIFDSLLNISSSVLLAWFTWGLPVVCLTY